jgi:hypothetical protein
MGHGERLSDYAGEATTTSLAKCKRFADEPAHFLRNLTPLLLQVFALRCCR